MTTKKTRALKENKVEKYPIQIPIALDKKEQLQGLADEMDLSLAQYCRCVLLKHLKENNTIFNNKQVTGEQPVEKSDTETIVEQTIDLVEEMKKPKTRGFGAK